MSFQKKASQHGQSIHSSSIITISFFSVFLSNFISCQKCATPQHLRSCKKRAGTPSRWWAGSPSPSNQSLQQKQKQTTVRNVLWKLGESDRENGDMRSCNIWRLRDDKVKACTSIQESREEKIPVTKTKWRPFMTFAMTMRRSSRYERTYTYGHRDWWAALKMIWMPEHQPRKGNGLVLWWYILGPWN